MSTRLGNKRLLGLFTALLLVWNSFVFFGAPGVANAEVSLNTDAQASPSTVAPGSSTTINVNVTPSENASIMIELGVYNSSLTRVYRQVIDNISVTAGVQTTIPVVWNVPADQAAGEYIVSYGIYGAGWNPAINHWYYDKTRITVGGSGPTLSFSSNASASPASVTVGNTVSVDAAVTANAAASNVAIDVSLLKPDGTTQATSSTFNDSFAANQTKHFTLNWAVPANATTGTYKAKVVVRSTDSSQTYHTNGNAGQFTVMAQSPGLSAPGNVQGTSTQTSVTLTWDAVSGATSYDVEADGTVTTGLTGQTYTHSGLQAGTAHAYRVRAKNAAETGPWSALVNVSTQPQNPGLPAPGNVQATAAQTSVTLTWGAVSGATSYDVEADGAVTTGLTGQTYTHSGLQAGTAHAYRVRAKNAAETGPWSTIVNATTLPASGPSSLRVRTQMTSGASTQMITPEFDIDNIGTTPINLADVKVRYYFTIDAEKPLVIDYYTNLSSKSLVSLAFANMEITTNTADHYLEIGFAPGAGQLQPGGTVLVSTWFHNSDWTYFNETNDYSYMYAQSATANPNVTGFVADELKWGTPPIPLNLPGSPANLAGTPTDTTVTLTWDPVAGATGYDVSANGTVVTNVSGTSYVDQWLLEGTSYVYKVRTRTNGTFGYWSAPITVKTTTQHPLTAPVNVKATKTGTSITLTWNAHGETVTGYDVEVDGTVVNAGNVTTYAHTGLTPATLHTYRVRAKNGSTLGDWSPLVKLNTVFTPTGAFTTNFTIDTSAERAPISPLIYGANEDMTGQEKFKYQRFGGNRTSTYNWENNASNAGKDYIHSSDNFVPSFYGQVPESQYDVPGIAVKAFHERALSNGAQTIVTLPTAGYVAKDKNGSVYPSETAPSSRWVEAVPAKNAPFSLTPNLNDNSVYIDEFVNYLVNTFGNASTSTGIKNYSLDNEAGLWSDTHPYMHPNPAGSAEVLNKAVALAKAVKNVDPFAKLFGPAAYGFSEYYDMQASPDWNSLKGSYGWYLDYYLDKFRVESGKAGKRLLDALDIHWYPEVYEVINGQTDWTRRVTRSDLNDSVYLNKARVQIPRSLWDPSYLETGWIADGYSSFLPLIPRLKQSIDKYNPGTLLSFSEYNYGGEAHVTGGIAVADVLGIFGKYGVYAANYWKMVQNVSQAPYTTAAFKLYNNYDGNGSGYGNTKVKADTNNIENSSIYGSVFTDSDNNLHLIAINKNFDFDMNAVFDIAGGTNYTSARIYAFDGNSSSVTERQAVTNITNNHFTYTIPKLTVCHIVLSANP